MAHNRYLQEINSSRSWYAVAKFKPPATGTVLRDRKDLVEAVRDVGIERVDSSNSEARFEFLSLFVNRKTAIDRRRSVCSS